MKNNEPELKLIDIDELSALTGLPKGSIRNMCWRREIPHIKINRLVRFCLPDIQRWLDEKKVETFNPESN